MLIHSITCPNFSPFQEPENSSIVFIHALIAHIYIQTFKMGSFSLFLVIINNTAMHMSAQIFLLDPYFTLISFGYMSRSGLAEFVSKTWF